MARKLKEFTPGRGYSKEDWDEVGDPHEPTEAQWAQAKSFAEMFPDLTAKTEASEGVKTDREMISLQLDSDVVAAFRATGAGWQSRMNAVLRAAILLRAKA
jgi:uncharacterized protein (DUF4415 family)